MNITAILNIIGHVMKYEIILLLIPFFVALFYGQGDAHAFLYTVLLLNIFIKYLRYFQYEKSTSCLISAGYFHIEN